MEKVIVIAGPTASGKTAVGVNVAKLMDTQIISADSMQIYRGMDIGTAKVTAQEMQGVAHHMIDITDPNTPYSLNDYISDATKIIEKIHSEKKVPLIVGGTGLYINSIIYNFNLQEAKKDDNLREELTNLYDKYGSEYMLNILREFDPETAMRLHPNNYRRIIRAIEMYKLSGITMSEQIKITNETKNKYEVSFFVLNQKRETLYERINKRVDIMIENGLIFEVQNLLDMGISPNSTAIQAIGYKEVVQYLNNQTSLEETIDTIKKLSRNYAKRQLTWFKRNKEAIWIDTEEYNSPLEIAQYIVSNTI